MALEERPYFQQLLARVVDDPGAPFEDEVLGVAARLRSTDRPAFERLLVALKAAKVGVTDWKKAIDAAEKASRSEELLEALEFDPRVLVIVDTNPADELRDIDEAMSAERDAYQRGGALVTIGWDADTGHTSRPVKRDAVPELLSRRMQFGRSSGEKLEIIRPPHDLCAGYHARGTWQLPYLRGIASGPVWCPDGRILATEGYDDETGIYLPRSYAIDVPEQPTRADALCAYETLRELLRDFPFADRASGEAATVALLLERLARLLLVGCSPLFFFAANIRGAGKGLLADVPYLIASGDRMPVGGGMPRDDAELDKRITAAAIGCMSSVILDNAKGKVGGPALEAAITGGVWQGRVLGESLMVTLPLRVTWVATGNGAALTPDMVRRTMPIQLHTLDPKPEGRTGLYYPRLREHVIEHRERYLTAAFTILRAYHVAGRPEVDMPPWGSFEAWSASIRAPLVWAGVADPIDARQGLEESADNDTAELRAVLAALHADGGAYFAGDLADMIADKFDDGALASALRELIRKPSPEGVSAALSRVYAERPVSMGDGTTLRLVSEVDSHRCRKKWSTAATAATTAATGEAHE